MADYRIAKVAQKEENMKTYPNGKPACVLTVQKPLNSYKLYLF